MIRRPAVFAAISTVVTLASAHAADQTKVLTGTVAFGGWEASEPGVTRMIRPKDLPAPHATPSASNSPGLYPRPKGAMPKVMKGFSVEVLASGLSQPRVVTTAPNGDVFVSDSGAGEVVVLRMGENGKVVKKSTFARGLDQPFGLAFYPSGNDPRFLYVANTGSVVRYPYHSGALQATGKAETVVAELPTGHHWTRDLVFSKDDRTLYVSVGSGSNDAEGTMRRKPPEGFVAANPKGATWGGEKWRADVLAFDPHGKNRRIVATGLRNCSGMALQPGTNALWCVVNERDDLGDNLPPDYATRVAPGAFYGWPWYYIGSHRDPRWQKAPRDDLKGKVAVPDVLFQAHSAPLGIGFYTGKAFPKEYQGDAFVALHGSWNRGQRTGYKLVRLLFRDGKPTGAYQDFMTGFVLSKDGVWGRPVDVTTAMDGSLLVSDDASGTIWRVSASNPAE